MIFDKLNKKDIPYAVMVGTTQFLSSRDISIKDYCIIGSRRDEDRLCEMGFRSKPLYLSHKAVLEYDMDECEVQEFKKRTSEEEFIKVLHNNCGRVYETKKKSFREYVN